jgi:hypothetical protein
MVYHAVTHSMFTINDANDANDVDNINNTMIISGY